VSEVHRDRGAPTSPSEPASAQNPTVAHAAIASGTPTSVDDTGRPRISITPA